MKMATFGGLVAALVGLQASVASSDAVDTHASTATASTYTWDVVSAGLADDYEAQALVFTLQGVVNQGSPPRLMLNTSTLDYASP